MRASRDLRLTQAFVLTDEELRRIFAAVSSMFGVSNLSATCADGIERSFSNLDELAAYENAPKRAIRSLRIKARSTDYKNSCLLRLEDGGNRNIFLSVEADEEHVLKISEMLEERLSSMRPWYHVIAKSNGFWWVVVPYSFFLIVALVEYAWSPGKLVLPEKWEIPVFVYVLGSLLGFVALLLAALVNRFKRAWFPMEVFAIGQGEKRHHDRDLIRTAVVVAFVVSVIASLVTSWLI